MYGWFTQCFFKSDHRSSPFGRKKVMKSYGKQLLIVFKANTVQLSMYLYSSIDSDLFKLRVIKILYFQPSALWPFHLHNFRIL